jgi:Glycosyltransferase family 87
MNAVVRYGRVAILMVAIARFALLIYSGQTYTRGDYYATLPGAYVEAINPTLWNSPDLMEIQGRAPTYLRGPSQYLTLFPLAYLDSYAQIAGVLLIVYAAVILLIAVVMRMALSELAGHAVSWAGIVGSTLLFFPLLQAYVAREFEIVIVLALALAFWAAIRCRDFALGGLLAYVTLFKYLPIISVPYFILRRAWRALAGFAATAAVIAALAHAAFGLDRFFNNHLPGMAAGQLTGLASSEAFCRGPEKLLRFAEANEDTSVRFALCSLNATLSVPAPVLYLLLILVTMSIAGWGLWRLERSRQPLRLETERWRRVWELSLVVIVSSTFFYAHYYYLCVLLLPLQALLVRFTEDAAPKARLVTLWFAVYLLLSAFALPPSFLGRLLHVDIWRLYITSLSYFVGELLLLGLVLHQYATLPIGAATPSSNA